MWPQNIDIWPQNINIWPQNIDKWPQDIDKWPQNIDIWAQNMDIWPQNIDIDTLPLRKTSFKNLFLEKESQRVNLFHTSIFFTKGGGKTIKKAIKSNNILKHLRIFSLSN